MERMDPVQCGQESSACLPPSESFAILADETRVAILEALWQQEETPASFSTLYEAVDADTSAQFNYHLDQLTGPFVRKREAGYELRTAGKHAVRATVAGSFNAHPTLEPYEMDAECVQCAGTLQARYADEVLTITCSACGFDHASDAVPPGGILDRDWPALLDAFDRRVRHVTQLARDGVCPECGGCVDTTLRADEECCRDVQDRVEFTCEQCGHSRCAAIGLSLVDRPAVITFHEDRDLDLEATPFWQLSWCVSDDYATLDPPGAGRAVVSVRLGEQELRVTLDEELAIVCTEEVPPRR